MDANKRRPPAEDYEDDGRSAKIARIATEEPEIDSSAPQQEDDQDFLDPVKPFPDYKIEGEDTAKAKYIIYMAIREPKSASPFSDGLAKCSSIYDPEIHSGCLQFDGTRHITMFDGYLTHQQARDLHFSSTFEPFEIQLDEWMPWKAGLYLKVNETSQDKLQSLLKQIQGLPVKGGKRQCNHLSLYRKRANTDKAKASEEFEKVRTGLKKYQWGNVVGASIRIKVFGSDYRECKILAGG